MTPNTHAPIGVYVHIPFCASRCLYCDFNSIADGSPPEARYAAAVAKEIAAIAQSEQLSRPATSIYIGGGTPSLLSTKAVDRILNAIKTVFTSVPPVEITIEVNPNSATLEKLQGYKDAGVNRLSLGVQSTDDLILKRLGRPHSAKDALAAYDAGRKAGFENIGVDLILGVPGQTIEGLKGCVKQIIALAPEHVSTYCLTIEEGTPYARLHQEGRLARLPEDVEIEMYSTAISLLKDAGWIHYEISNLSHPGFQGIHNSAYWHGRDYIGVGAGAHSYLSYPDWGRRWWNTASPEAYMATMETISESLAGSETLTQGEALTEAVMLGLRDLITGMDAASFQRRFNKPLKEALPTWSGLVAAGLIEERGNNLRLTSKGLLISNEVFLRLKGI